MILPVEERKSKFHGISCKNRVMVIFLLRDLETVYISEFQEETDWSRSSMDRMTDSGSVG